MGLPFPTCNGPDDDGHVSPPGEPERADPCRCAKPIELKDGSCLTCGRWTHRTVSETWRQRAKTIRRAKGLE